MRTAIRRGGSLASVSVAIVLAGAMKLIQDRTDVVAGQSSDSRQGASDRSPRHICLTD